MKQDLKKHIKEIFNSLKITVPFQVFDCNVDILPKWTTNIQLTNEFFVCCQDLSLKQRLQVFTGRNIFENGKYIYWFEGERILTIEQPEKNEIKTNIKNESIDYLKTETRLPNFLDDLIFNHLNAIYAPDFERFDYNLDLTKDEVLKYLGTYFPRSYAESFCIFDNIFQNSVYNHIIFNKKSLNILTIGTGTGGDIIGLLTAIEKHFHIVSEINVWALDGNNEALSVLRQIIDNFNDQTSKSVKLKTLESVFNSISDFQCKEITDNKFDFILSFKLICEIITMGEGKLDNSYYDFVHKFLPMLSNKPLPCSVYSKSCYFNCFQQKTFTVTHTKHTKDKSKVAYRIISNVDLVNKISPFEKDSKYLINKDKICPYSEKNKEFKDAYFLK